MSVVRERVSHPPGLYVLFFTELWERYSFYSMMAILSLYMNEALHFDVAHVGRVYGAYTAGVYFLPLFGGLLADRILGFNRAIIIGGVLMMLGHLVLGVESLPFFYTGARAARLRQRAAQAEHLDARRQPVSRPAGAARSGLQHLLHGHQPRRVRLAAHRLVAPHALRVGAGVHVRGGRHALLAAHLHRVQPPRRRRGREGRGDVGRSAGHQPRRMRARASSR